MSDASPRDRLARLRVERRTAERERNRVGSVLAAVTEFRERVRRGGPTDPPSSLWNAVEAFGPRDGGADRRETLSYLRTPLPLPADVDRAGRDRKAERSAFARLRSRTLTVEVASIVNALEAYVAGEGDWAAVRDALESVVAAIREGERADAIGHLEDLAAMFEVATGASLAYRDDRTEQVNEVAKAEYLAESGKPLSDLDGQPVALLPVRLETRFVGPADDSDAETEQLRVRVYPDQIHVDAHEPELTDDEVDWGRRFWMHVWLGCHKEVDRWDAPGEAGAEWIEPEPGTVPADRRALITDFDPTEFGTGREGYRQVKTEAWRQLAERFGAERASWVVRATAPERGADELLGAQSADGEPLELPPLSFPPADRRPSSWTAQPRARLLPDRWIASFHWEDADGDERSATVRGSPIREPLPVGPSPDALSTWRRGEERTDARGGNAEAAPGRDPAGAALPGMEWTVNFSEARAAGMGLTVDLSDLAGFDPDRGFTRVVVLGARESTDADASADALAELLDAHHRSDGLAVLPQGTPTNVFEGESGYSSDDDAEASVDWAAGPPRSTANNGTDGDLLARALGVTGDEGERHVFANVPNAGRTEQRDARHANAALWPATIGYFVQHLLVGNEWVQGDSLWDDSATLSKSERRERLVALLPWVNAYRDHFVEYVRARGPLPAIRVGTQPYGVLPTGTLAPDTDPAAPVDERLSQNLAGWLRRFDSAWTDAVEGLPWTSGSLDDDTITGVLQREATAHDVVKRQYRRQVPKSKLKGQRARIRRTLRRRDMTELDPRFANLGFAGADSIIEGIGGVRRDRFRPNDDGPPPASVDKIAPADFVADDAGATLELLASEPPSSIRDLGLDLDAETAWAMRKATTAVTSGESGDDGEEDVADVIARLLDGATLDPGTAARVEAVFDALDRQTDSESAPTPPSSLLEVLLHYATMHAYLNGRVQLGSRFDDPGVLAPDPPFYLPSPIPDFPGDPPYYAAIEDRVPDEITAHPAVGAGDSYGDALFAGAVDATQPASIEPRLSEFADALRHLATMDRSELATLLTESLDLASHRLDAWWTSLSTRRLAELRARQGAWGPIEEPYEEWDPDDGDDSNDGGDGSDGSDDGANDSEDAGATTPGVHVGAYGFVEDLAADPPKGDGEYIHAPSLQHATTAALLRSGHEAHQGDAMGSALSVDLSAARVRAALELIYGVRDGRSLAELLGYRFERRLVDRTLADDDAVNVRQYRDAFRAAFPLERADDANAETTDRTGDGVAGDIVDGYELARDWEDYPFGRRDLPSRRSDEFAQLDAIVSDLTSALDAVGDLLTAESVHQLGKGNFDRVAASVEALSAGTAPPDPAVARTPRTEVGVTHRTAVLFGDPESVATPSEWSTATPVPVTDYPEVPGGPDVGDGGEDAAFQVRSDAAPVLDAWVGELLPAPGDVEFLATYRVPTGEGRDAGESAASADDRLVQRTVTLAELELGPLDLLALGTRTDRPARSEFEARAACHLLRDRPDHNPPIPADATVELALTETDREAAVPVADLLGVVERVRALVQDGRPLDGTDVAHPEEDPAPGYGPESTEILRDRADDAEATLAAVHAALENRLALLEPPGDEASVLSQLDDVAAAADAFVEAVPVDRLLEVPTALEGALAADLGKLDNRLAARERGRVAADEAVVVEAAAEQIVSGQLGEPSPAVAPGSTLGRGSVPADGDGRASRRRVEALGAVEGIDSLLVNPAPAGSGDRSGQASGSDTDAGASTDGGADGGAIDGSTVRTTPDQFTDAEVEVILWSRSPTDWFERTARTTSNGRGAFAVHVDLSDIEPGTSFAVIGVVDGEVGFVDHGRVVDERSAVERGESSGSTALKGLAEAAPVLSGLLWIDGLRPDLSVDDGADSSAAALDAAVAETAWATAERERELFDPSWSTLAEADLAATNAMLDLQGADLSVLDATVTDALAELDGTGATPVLDAGGDPTSPDDRDGPGGEEPSPIRARRPELDAAVRNRIRRYRDAPVAFNRDLPRALLGFAPVAATAIDETDDPTRLAAYLHALLDCPATAVAVLAGHADEPHGLLADLGEWLYHAEADDAVDEDAVAARVEALADAVADLEAFDTLCDVFEPEPVDGGDASDGLPHRTSFERLLRQLAEELDDRAPPQLPDETEQRAAAEAAVSESVTALEAAIDDHVAPVRRATEARGTAGEAAASFRHGVLETVRVPLRRASYFGVGNSTPRSAVGGATGDELTLRSQASAVADRVEERLAEAAGAAPDEDLPVERAVEAQERRLRALFGPEFVTLPPFVPANGTELARTFRNDALLDAGPPLAAETWLQRVAQVRDRTAGFREALTCVEAVTGTLVRDLSVGQLPHRPSDDWVGLDGVAPSSGHLSLVAQFGLGHGPSDLTGPTCGLFVDEHVEHVPPAEETTGLAINYDEPDNRAPQSILLAVPPEGGEWTVAALQSAVDEVMQLYKLRAVDLEDLADFGHLLPMLSFAYNTASPPETPSIDFDVLESPARERMDDAPSHRTFADFDLADALDRDRS